VHQVGDQPKLYYDARSTNHQDQECCLIQGVALLCCLHILRNNIKIMQITVHEYKCILCYQIYNRNEYQEYFLGGKGG